MTAPHDDGVGRVPPRWLIAAIWFIGHPIKAIRRPRFWWTMAGAVHKTMENERGR